MPPARSGRVVQGEDNIQRRYLVIAHGTPGTTRFTCASSTQVKQLPQNDSGKPPMPSLLARIAALKRQYRSRRGADRRHEDFTVSTTIAAALVMVRPGGIRRNALASGIVPQQTAKGSTSTGACAKHRGISLILLHVSAGRGFDDMIVSTARRCWGAGKIYHLVECRFIQASQSGHQLPGVSLADSSQSLASDPRLSFSQCARCCGRAGL